MRPKLKSIYFHSDFDGAVSAAILVRLGNEVLELYPVDYHMKKSWENMCLHRPAAVVDFLFHPDADIWFDHHSTPFLKEEWKSHYYHQKSKWKNWDVKGLSCPVIISQHIDMPNDIREHFRDYNEWSAVIDSASYSSCQQATDLNNPYILLAKIISDKENIPFLGEIVRKISDHKIHDVINDDKILIMAQKIQKLEREVRTNLKRITKYNGLIVLFDQSRYSWPYQRFHPYLLYPDASFVVGIYKSENYYTISVGSNPWKAPPEVDLAEICLTYGGGGHKTVAGVVVPSLSKAKAIAEQINYQLLALYRKK